VHVAFGASLFSSHLSQAHPEALGAAPYNKDSALPYLLKVLSIAKALSVQSHPDKALAERLHASRPDLYKDDNHKPELACALTPFEAMCGFRPLEELVANIRGTPELAEIIGEDETKAFLEAATSSTGGAAHKEALKAAFHAMMSQPQAVVEENTAALEKRLSAKDPSSLTEAESIALRLCSQFPLDVGLFAPFLLNTITLAPGEAVFLGANEPHAYLSGNCVEVMATSDNVVRAGLTPKHKDVPTLTSMLTYNLGKPDVQKGLQLDEWTREYTGTVSEFALQRIQNPSTKSSSTASSSSYKLPPIPSAAIIVVLDGEVESEVTGSTPTTTIKLKKGDIYLQPANVEVSLKHSEQDVLLFRAHANPPSHVAASKAMHERNFGNSSGTGSS
jgi:mannose-6-phosphate isomerase